MKKSQVSAVIFINVMMLLFYGSLFCLILGFLLTIASQKIHIMFIISSIIFCITILSNLLIENLDKNLFESNFTKKARWVFKKNRR